MTVRWQGAYGALMCVTADYLTSHPEDLAAVWLDARPTCMRSATGEILRLDSE